jgi:hypothetical protein
LLKTLDIAKQQVGLLVVLEARQWR